MVYTRCGASCPPTCGLTDAICHAVCREGCICKTGYLMDVNGMCVKEDNCSILV